MATAAEIVSDALIYSVHSVKKQRNQFKCRLNRIFTLSVNIFSNFTIFIYTTVQNGQDVKNISPKLHLLNQKYTKNRNIVKYLYNSKKLSFILIHFKMQFIPVMATLNFQHHYSSLQCHMILQKSLWYADLKLKKHLSSVLKTVLFNICGNQDTFFRIYIFFYISFKV